MSKKVWLASADEMYFGAKGMIYLCERKPVLDADNVICEEKSKVVVDFCRSDFKRITGFKLKLGEVQQVTINIEPVGEVQQLFKIPKR